MSGGQFFLGLHIGHDRAITVADSERIVFHTAVERLDREKHSESHRLPETELRLILDYLGLGMVEFQGACISYHGVDSARITATMQSDFQRRFPDFRGRFSTLDHHLAHALATHVCSGFDSALVFVADGSGDQRLWGTQAESVFHVGKEMFYLLDERLQSHPLTHIGRPEFYEPSFFRPEDAGRQISLGLKYEQITYLCGFRAGQAGQTMALAGFGEPLFDFRHMLPGDLGFSLRYPDFLREFEQLAAAEGQTLREFALTRRADIAATYQQFLEEALSRIMRSITTATDAANVCFAGGLFLNCISNRRLHNDLAGRDLYFLPACNDEGQSLGTAAYAFWQESGRLPAMSEEFPYLGRAFDNDQCAAALRAASLRYEILADDQLSRQLAALLCEGFIVGVLRGRSEAGPRALGHRSILADPGDRTLKDRLDRGIKRRAEFRPYAPMMSEGAIGHLTDLDTPSPHMLLTVQVREEFRSALPGIVHVDGSTRVQTVNGRDDPFLAQLLEDFEAVAGLPVLLNTSFNDELEPMVDSPADAIRVFLSTDLDALVLGNCLHLRRERSHSRHR